MSRSYRFEVCGRVQGVGFRQATRAEALRLGVHGWVRNRADGAVEGAAGGPAEALAALQCWLQQGPSLARVDRLQWQAIAVDPDAAGFVIR